MNSFAKYLEVHRECRVAIQEFNQIKSGKSERSLEEWTRKYKTLYQKISYGPEGMPDIADANIEGIHFTYISQFYSIFNQREYYFIDDSDHTMNFLKV
ncbi:MAG TPA: hypothetical protein VMU83_14095 [Hanamia sp.]|nr:hypothetical protein [Hanamia sp.]